MRGDVRDRDAVADGVRRARPEVVFHLAAQAIVRAALEEPAGTYDVNVVGTAHVLEAAGDAAIGVRHERQVLRAGPGTAPRG